MRLQYNAPVTLTYTLIAAAVLAIETLTPFTGIMRYFTVGPDAQFTNPIWYLTLITHVIGHGDLGHLVSNFTLILLLGPILEEKYGSKDLLTMMLVTALVTGILHVIVASEAGLLGASGIVFMLILLSSITNTKGGIPLTFILVMILFLGKEFYQIFQEKIGSTENQISEFTHIIGGIMGGIFGFFLQKNETKSQKS